MGRIPKGDTMSDVDGPPMNAKGERVFCAGCQKERWLVPIEVTRNNYQLDCPVCAARGIDSGLRYE